MGTYAKAGRISEARAGIDYPKGENNPEPAGGEQKRRPWSGMLSGFDALFSPSDGRNGAAASRTSHPPAPNFGAGREGARLALEGAVGGSWFLPPAMYAKRRVDIVSRDVFAPERGT